MKARPAVRIESRAQLVHRIRQELEQRGWPRVQMMLLVMLTGGAGFLASFALLTMGVDSLALRYPLAVGIAYLVFLLLLWLWLRTSPEDYDGLDTAVGEIIEAMPQAAARTANRTIGGGGQFGGGGSTSHWTSSTHSEPLVELPDVPAPNVNLSDADEVAIPLVVVLFVAGLVLTVLFASMSIVFSAPILFAEMIVDGVLAATLYRRLRRIDTRHWLHSAVRRTAVPFAITAVFVAVGGAALSNYAPGARTLGEVVTMLAQAA
jgi:hypothetical protein